MKIVHIINSLNIGGAETMLVDIVNIMCLQNDVSIIIINKSYMDCMLSAIDSRVKIFFINRKQASRNPFPFIKLNFLLLKMKPDAVHVHHFSITQVLFVPYKTYYTVHSIKLQLSSSCKKLRRLFAISQSVKEDIDTRYSNKYPTVCIPNGVNVAEIKRKSDYCVGDIFRIVQVARLSFWNKGQDILVEAMALLKNRGFSNIKVDFIGDGPDTENLKQLILNNGLSEHITLLGLKDREYIYSHLSDYDLMCHPFRREGFGLVIPEAMAAGLPVLVSDSEGPFEIIQRGKYGFHFKTACPEELADAIVTLMEDYQNLVLDVVNPAIEHVKNNYSIERMVAQYIDEYKS